MVRACSFRLWCVARRRFRLYGLLAALLLAACTLPATSPPTPVALRLTTDSPGIYRIRAAELARMGMPAPLAAAWHLAWRGAPHGMLADADGLTFYVPPRPMPTTQQIYLLQPTPPATATSSLPALPPDPRTHRRLPTLPADAAPATAWHTPSVRYDPLATSGDGWLGNRMIAPHREELVLELPDALPARATLSLAVWGSSSSPVQPAHHLNISLNGHPLPPIAWDGPTYHVVTLDVPAGVVQAGSNTIALELPARPDVLVDVQQLDWLALDYARPLHALDGALAFVGTGTPQHLTGWQRDPVQIYDVTDPTQPVLAATLAPQQGSVAFTGSPRQHYLAVEPHGYRQPDVVPLAANDVSIGTPAADYLVIGAPALLAAAAPLLEHRRTQGMQVDTLTPQQIYNQFAAGTPDPFAIRAAVQQVAPRYVLLLGDATYDPAGYTAPPPPFDLPGVTVFTRFGGHTISDVPLADLDADHRPDLAIGRIPAQTPQQVQTLAMRIVAHETHPPVAAPQILAIADGHEARFVQDAHHFTAALDRPPTRVQLASGSRSAIQTALHTSPQLVAYFGHGSLQQWGQDGLLTLDDIPTLPANSAPVMLHFTCLTGLFTHPQQPSLAESLLWQPDGSTVALLAPTSLTLPDDQAQLVQVLAAHLASPPDVRLGDALLATWQQLAPYNDGSQDVLETFLLLGDPAMRVW